jgi:hypothetical protein
MNGKPQGNPKMGPFFKTNVKHIKNIKRLSDLKKQILIKKFLIIYRKI